MFRCGLTPPGRMNAFVVRAMGTELVTVRIDLDPLT